jgi:hypothetical protein
LLAVGGSNSSNACFNAGTHAMVFFGVSHLPCSLTQHCLLCCTHGMAMPWFCEVTHSVVAPS